MYSCLFISTFSPTSTHAMRPGSADSCPSICSVKKGRKSDDSRKISKKRKSLSRSAPVNIRKHRCDDSESEEVSSEDPRELASSDDARDDEVSAFAILCVASEILKTSIAGFEQYE